MLTAITLGIVALVKKKNDEKKRKEREVDIIQKQRPEDTMALKEELEEYNGNSKFGEKLQCVDCLEEINEKTSFSCGCSVSLCKKCYYNYIKSGKCPKCHKKITKGE